MGGLAAPQDDGFSNLNMVLGHGFDGQLSASVYLPPSGNDDYSMLHIWVLQREGPSFHWHKLLAFRSTVFNVADDFFIPLVCYYGVGDDGVIHILLHRNKEEIVCVIPATKQVLPVAGAAFPPAGILAVPSGIPMEVADSRKFKATQASRF